MSVSETHVFTDGAALATAAAEALLERSRAAIEAHGFFTLALTGGSTPRVLYEKLAAAEQRGRTDWARWRVFFGDERAVGPDHADSNYRMAHEALLAHVPIPPAQVHRLAGEAAFDPATAERYAATLAREVPPNPALHGGFPAFDLLLLGMGADGHVASLFPGTAALAETTQWVVVNSVPQLGTQRLTLTLPVLNAAHEAWLMVTGANKAERVRQALVPVPPAPAAPRYIPGLTRAIDPVGPAGSEPRGSGLPVTLVRPAAGRLVWWLDAPAARLLPAGR